MAFSTLNFLCNNMAKKKNGCEKWKKIYFSTHAFLKTFCQTQLKVKPT